MCDPQPPGATRGAPCAGMNDPDPALRFPDSSTAAAPSCAVRQPASRWQARCRRDMQENPCSGSTCWRRPCVGRVQLEVEVLESQ